MAILDIITAPHPILKNPAREVAPEEFGDALSQHVSDMAQTMYAAPGVGLAAPQVADPRRIVVVDSGIEDGPNNGLMKMVNPQITERSKEMIPWVETCLSVPGFEVRVQRHQRIKVRWQDPQNGSWCQDTFEDYESVIVQHELDHLVGTILLDKASRLKRGRYLKRAARQRQLEAV